jgi:spore germination protein YaaH
MRGWAARLTAPAAFLAAVTVAVLLVRAGLQENDPVPRIEPAAAAVAAPGRRVHLVRRGDTLEAIAARYRTTVPRLRKLNSGLDPVDLRVGVRVRVR